MNSRSKHRLLTRRSRIALVLDLENLLHRFRERGDWDGARRALSAVVGAFGRRGTLVSKIACCDRDLTARLAFPLFELGVRVFPHQGGPDRADHDLLRRIELDLPRSCDLIVIGSGDHAFVDAVRRLRSRGKRVEVVAPSGSLSADLYRFADGFVPMPV